MPGVRILMIQMPIDACPDYKISAKRCLFTVLQKPGVAV